MKLHFNLKVPFFVLILNGILFIGNNEATIIIPSVLMAMSGGLLMGKMTLGGLMMMMMAANQQQNGYGFLRNLGVIPQPTPSTGISVPSEGNSGISEPILEPFQELIVRRRRFLRRERRDIGASLANITTSISSSDINNGTMAKNMSTTTEAKPMLIDEITQYRIMRQVASTDPLSCLPQALCGISAVTPSKQSGFLNDYAYILKTVFTRDEEIDDLDDNDDSLNEAQFETIKFNGNKKVVKSKKPSNGKYSVTKTKLVTKSEDSKPKTKGSKKKKKPVKDDESSEEDEEAAPISDDELDRAMMREQFEVEEMANEELLNDEPDFFPYAVKDSLENIKYGPYSEGYPRRPDDLRPPFEEEETIGVAPSDLHKMSEAELDAMLDKLGGPPGSGPGHGPPGRGPPGRGPPGGYGRPPSEPSGGKQESLLSSMLPKLSMGLTPGKTAGFDDDPFFSGYKRSIDQALKAAGNDDDVEIKLNARPATTEEEKLFDEMKRRRLSRVKYIISKQKELAEIQDPVEKFRIAAEFGDRIKSPRQCRVLFNNCPFNYTQVLEMLAGLRKVVLGQPLKEPERDTVVTLRPVMVVTPAPIIQTPAPAPVTVAPIPVVVPQPQAASSIFNVNTGVGGITSIRHELPTGEKVEINLKMTKTGLTSNQSKTRKSKPPPPATQKPSILSMLTKPKKKRPAPDLEDLFEDDSPISVVKKPIASTISGGNEAISSSLTNLESLKATMMAIQKINNVTIQRKKSGKPISSAHILAELNGKTYKSPMGSSELESAEDGDGDEDTVLVVEKLPEPDPLVLSKLQAQNSKPIPSKITNPTSSVSPIKSNSPQKTASLLATSLSKVQEDDDEIEELLPNPNPIRAHSKETSKITSSGTGAGGRPSSSGPALPPGRNKNKIPAKNTGSKSNEELAEILANLKKVNSENPKGSSSSNKKKPQDEEDDEDATDEEDEDNDDENDDEQDDEPEEEEEVLYLKSDLPKEAVAAEEEERVVINVPFDDNPTSSSSGSMIATQFFDKRRLPPNNRAPLSIPYSKPTASAPDTDRNRKPRRLFRYDSDLPRFVPL